MENKFRKSIGLPDAVIVVAKSNAIMEAVAFAEKTKTEEGFFRNILFFGRNRINDSLFNA